jgi:hypothetical protein
MMWPWHTQNKIDDAISIIALVGIVYLLLELFG